MRGWLGFLLAAGIFIGVASQYASAGSTNIQISGLQSNYTPGQPVSGLVSVSFDTLLPRTAVMQAYMNGNKLSEISLFNYTKDASYYSYTTSYFSYNLTSQGSSTWFEYPTQTFSYRPRAEGTCGGIYCYNSTTNVDNCQCPTACTNYSSAQKYPCSWSLTLTDNPVPSSSVKGSEGVKFIRNAADTINVPTSANDFVVWSDVGNNNPSVNVYMREACSHEFYIRSEVWDDGWMRVTIDKNWPKPVAGTNYYEFTFDRFDNASLMANLTGGPGGIYKDAFYQAWEYTPTGFTDKAGIYWNGTSGYIRIYNYNPNSAYMIIYLPPNGPHVCAYTATKVTNSSPWNRNYPITGAYCTLKQPYSQAYTQIQFDAYMSPTSCPSYALQSDCSKNNVAYGAIKISGPSDVMFTFNASSLTAYAYTTSTELADSTGRPANYSIETGIPLSSFSNIRAKTSAGISTLELRIVNNGATLGSQQFNIGTCIDADGDVYCSVREGGMDCNDTSPKVHPGANETCNGIDDNCNNQMDEGFNVAGKTLGTLCNNWNGSACAGQWVCTNNGTGAICKASHLPGELAEICDNGIDDNCDGVVDEVTKAAGGQLVNGCVCKNGATKLCGSIVGACKAGYQVCANGVWSVCRDSVDPQTETCNGKDDNCDGIVDNIGGGTSAQTTKCGCFGGILPKVEMCNGIDDNCDGQIDEGINCCSSGDTRPCGLTNGACTAGTETCKVNQWSGDCLGGIQPGNPKVDGNCNRVPDCPASDLITENCVCGNSTYEGGFCCSGFYSNAPCSDYNFSMWMVIAGVAIMLVVAFWIVAVKVIPA